MRADSLEEISTRLEGLGHEAGELRDLQVELDMFDEIPSRWSRFSGRVKDFAKSQWALLSGEFKESREALRITRAAMSEGAVSEEERAQVRAQVLDMMRLLPAGAIVFANVVLPLPGTSVFTPKILKKLGLLPSRWREAHLLTHLQKEVNHLRSEGLDDEADKIAEICVQIEEDSRCRLQIEMDTRLLSHWDEDDDGEWDPEEREVYNAALEHVVQKIGKQGDSRCWYLLEEGEVIGPIRESSLPSPEEAGEVFICDSEERLWVSLSQVLSTAVG
jgi:hypothetical protein